MCHNLQSSEIRAVNVMCVRNTFEPEALYEAERRDITATVFAPHALTLLADRISQERITPD
jgi:hypothetical protein